MYLATVLKAFASGKRKYDSEDLYKLNEALFNLPEEDTVDGKMTAELFSVISTIAKIYQGGKYDRNDPNFFYDYVALLSTMQNQPFFNQRQNTQMLNWLVEAVKEDSNGVPDVKPQAKESRGDSRKSEAMAKDIAKLEAANRQMEEELAKLKDLQSAVMALKTFKPPRRRGGEEAGGRGNERAREDKPAEEGSKEGRKRTRKPPPPLLAPFLAALKSKAEALGPGAGDAMGEAEATAEAVRWVESHAGDVEKALATFAADGKRADGGDMPASAFNDFYKFTMLPVAWATHKSQEGGVRCTFSVNIRDKDYRQQLVDSATGKSGPELLRTLRRGLEGLASRHFDRDVFERCAQDMGLPNWGEDVLDEVCGPKGSPNRLVDQVLVDPEASEPAHPAHPNDVIVQLFVANDSKLGEERVYIEASGPWPRVTWLETTLMQSVYEALFRDRNRKLYGERDNQWYPKWLAEAFVRCVRSTVAANASGLEGALFTGRRTGGLALMMLQGMYIEDNFKDEKGVSKHKGTSSVTSHYWLKDAGVAAEIIPKPAGTHAHELSMVLSAVFGELDDKVGMPLSQVIGHCSYFYQSPPQGDVNVDAKNLMPMLPDTLGTPAFMKTASMLTIPRGVHKGKPVLSIIGAARQDSGPLVDFTKIMEEFKFEGALMASEIENSGDMVTSKGLGYKLFGAGGFFGDSEHAWNKDVKNISMAVKVLRVYKNGELCQHYPVKTGDDPTGSKFEADGTVDDKRLEEIKARTKVIQACETKVSKDELQQLFAEALGVLTGKKE